MKTRNKTQPKIFKRLDIDGDYLQIIVLDQDKGKEEEACRIDMSPFYWEVGHLKDNIFTGNKPNEEFLENFCCDISSQIEFAFHDYDIATEYEIDCLDLFNKLLEEKFGV